MNNEEIVTLKIEDIRPLLNQKVIVRFSDTHHLSAEVTEVSTLKNFANSNTEPFSFTLRTEQKNEYFPQAIYPIEHPTKGDLAVFMVPIGFDAEGMKYEIIFS